MAAHTSPWGTVAKLKPTQLSAVCYKERLVRGDTWLFLHNDITGQHVRVSALASQVVQALDGRTSVQGIVDRLAMDAELAEREALASSLMALAQMGMISLCDENSDRLIHFRAQKLESNPARPWHNLLAVRIPLFNPDAWLRQCLARLSSILQPFLLWWIFGFLLLAAGAVVLNLSEIGSQLREVARTPQQWWQMLIIYPFLKAVHEFAHGIVLKRLGGHVHEAGITILVLMPVPYVDATDTWRFERTSLRVLVCASGMLAEGVIAAMGLFVWLIVEPGALANLGFAVALTGSITTLLFNANPLLKFDGYQILQDVLGIPNLASRSSRYLLYCCKRYLLGVRAAISPVTAYGERRWLIGYGVLAGGYRWVITIGIALYLASRFPVLGSLLAVFALFKLIVSPCIAVVRYLASNAELHQLRTRAISVTLSMLCVCAGMLFLIPFPSYTRADGIVGVSQQAQLYAPQSGVLAELYVEQGELVMAGQPVLRISAPDIATEVEVVTSEIDVLELERNAAQVVEIAEVPALERELEDKKKIMNQRQLELESLVLRSKVDGRVSLAEGYSHVGEYILEGASLGHIVNSSEMLIETVVPQSRIAMIEKGVRAVEVRLGERFEEPIPGVITRKKPAADRQLPSQAVAFNAHGGITVASSDDQGLKSVDPVFHMEIEMPSDTQVVGIGGRAYVTLLHNPEPIGIRSWRMFRRLLLDELSL